MNHPRFMIKKLTMQNWKCFKFKTIKFETFNQFTQENGFGKSSIFQAIIYCLYGKLPVSNSNDLKTDKDKPIKLELTIEEVETGRTIKIVREIYSAQKKVNYITWDKDKKKQFSATQMNEYLSKICGSPKMFPLIWSNDPLYNSRIFDFNYVKDEILSDIFVESNTQLQRTKQYKFYLTKQLKDLDKKLGENKNKEDIEKSIEEFKEKINNINKVILNKTSHVDDRQYNKALQILEYKRELEQMNLFYTKEEIEENTELLRKLPILKRTVKEYISGYKELLRSVELFDRSKVEDVIKENSETGLCPVCGNKHKIIPEDMVDTVFELLDNGNLVTEEAYNEAVELVEKAELIDKEKMEESKNYLKLSQEIETVPNPEEIVNKYNKEVNDLLKELNDLQKELQLKEQMMLNVKEYLILKEETDRLAQVETAIITYNKELINNQLNQILIKAGKILSETDKRFCGIYYDINANEYQVAIIKNEELLVLGIGNLSSGEKSMVALSLILSIRELYKTADFILLDESLSSLDADHLSKCFELIKNQKNTQSFIINHN